MSSDAIAQDFILYHVISDEACATVRRLIVQNDLAERVRFRNIDLSEEARNDLLALQGNSNVPFLVAGSQSYSAAPAILEFLLTA